MLDAFLVLVFLSSLLFPLFLFPPNSPLSFFPPHFQLNSCLLFLFVTTANQRSVLNPRRRL
ncbi:uncharacterized protein IWZ02DRAFT_459958 [Phyllosticta citriasiana]|uniref:Uncharacterized protein n=1 Tax=Phyllosticta citriasiana TaxID=595635 RepID=A0ABR1KDN4_9PEZI